uniref:Uncharacterized protein n=1 Tax=Planktothricoides sp. SpSt-374 TaxID=2282167 RepID=A0A7C3VG72_9CYAN
MFLMVLGEVELWRAGNFQAYGIILCLLPGRRGDGGMGGPGDGGTGGRGDGEMGGWGDRETGGPGDGEMGG